MSLLDTNFDVTEDQLFGIFVIDLVKTNRCIGDHCNIRELKFEQPRKNIKRFEKFCLMLGISKINNGCGILKFIDNNNINSYFPNSDIIWVPIKFLQKNYVSYFSKYDKVSLNLKVAYDLFYNRELLNDKFIPFPR